MLLFAIPLSLFAVFFANVFIVGYFSAPAPKAKKNRSPKWPKVLAWVVLFFTLLPILILPLGSVGMVVVSIANLYEGVSKPVDVFLSVAFLLGVLVGIPALIFLSARSGRRYGLKSSNQTTNRKRVKQALIGIIIAYIALQGAVFVGTNAARTLATFCDPFYNVNSTVGESKSGELWHESYKKDNTEKDVTGKFTVQPNTKEDWDAHIIKAQALVEVSPAEFRDKSAPYIRMVKAHAELRAKYGYTDPSKYPAGVYDKFQINHADDIRQSTEYYEAVAAYCAKEAQDLSTKFKW